jgi:hypothetical protein
MIFVLIVAGFACGSVVRAVVVNFDDLPDIYDLTNSGYAGLDWPRGNVGLDGLAGAWFVISDRPSSPPRRATNAQGSTLMPIGFGSPINMVGAFVAPQGNIAPATMLRVHGFHGVDEFAATPWFNLTSAVPAWLDMSGLLNVDRIVIEAVPVSENAAGYGIDDLTFTYVPEPAGISLGLLALGGMLLRRRRENA